MDRHGVSKIYKNLFALVGAVGRVVEAVVAAARVVAEEVGVERAADEYAQVVAGADRLVVAVGAEAVGQQVDEAGAVELLVADVLGVDCGHAACLDAYVEDGVSVEDHARHDAIVAVEEVAVLLGGACVHVRRVEYACSVACSGLFCLVFSKKRINRVIRTEKVRTWK